MTKNIKRPENGSAPKTVHDVARKAGVSIATVSRVFAGLDVVLPPTRKKVLLAARQLGFQLNQSARRLRGSRSGLVGFIASQLRNPDHITYFHTMEAEARLRGYEVLIADSEFSYRYELANIERMRKNQVEGMLIFPVSEVLGSPPASHMRHFHAHNLPCVLLGNLKGSSLPVITADERGGAKELAEGLFQRGWRRIIFANGEPMKNDVVYQRVDGMREAWKTLTGTASAFRLLQVSKMEMDPRLNTKPISEIIGAIKKCPPKTVLVTINDGMAFHLYGPLQDAGIAIPQDIGLAAFGASPLSTCFRPQLTKSEPDHAAIALAASETLFQMLTGTSPVQQTRLFPCPVTWRESSETV